MPELLDSHRLATHLGIGPALTDIDAIRTDGLRPTAFRVDGGLEPVVAGDSVRGIDVGSRLGCRQDVRVASRLARLRSHIHVDVDVFAAATRVKCPPAHLDCAKAERFHLVGAAARVWISDADRATTEKNIAAAADIDPAQTHRHVSRFAHGEGRVEAVGFQARRSSN